MARLSINDIEFSNDRLDKIKSHADIYYKTVLKDSNRRREQIVYAALKKLHEEQNPHYALAAYSMKEVPVTIDEFIQSEDFLGHDSDFQVWPSLMNDLRMINKDIWLGATHCHEALDGGATGTGKTHIAMITQAFQLYQLCCFEKPVKLWSRLSTNTPLIFMFQSVQERITRRVIYEPFRQLFTNMPFVEKHVTYNRDRENVLELDNGVTVVPALANVTGLVGQAIVSCLLDEVNFMAVVEDSKQVVGNRGQGGHFDQAELVYSTISRRRKGRFITRGPSPGCISVLSSTRYLNDFMDRRMNEVADLIETEGRNNVPIHIMRRKQYEAQPQDDYSGQKIRILVGSVEYGTRILADDEIPGEDYPENATVEHVPIEYKHEFMRDPEGTLRDVCGIATDVLSPFITQRHKIVDAIMRGRERKMKCWVVKADVELAVDGMPQIIEANLPKDLDTPRFVHIDLSINKDRCGLAILKILGHVAITDPVTGVVENMPHYCLEQGISIAPDRAHEIDIADVRKWVVNLKEYYKINIHTVTYDGFNSHESIAMLRKLGIQSMKVSVDTSMEPYEMLKTAIYQDRFDMQDHELLKVELSGLELDTKKGKVDHSPHLSKDVSDAVAGALYSASVARVTRAKTSTTSGEGDTGTRDAKGRLRHTKRRTSTHRRLSR